MNSRLFILAFISLFIFISCSSNGQDTKTHFEKGVSFYEKKEYEKAKHEFDKAIEIKPDYYEAWNKKGLAYYYLHNYDEAIKCFYKAIEIKQDYFEAWNNKGRAFGMLEKYDDAMKCHNKAIEINPEYADAYYWRGVVYFDMKKHKEAINDYNKAIEINPEYAGAYYNRGYTYFDMKEYQKAIDDFTKTIEVNKNFGLAYYMRGYTYHHNMKEFVKAIKDYNKAIEINSKDSVTYEAKKNVYYDIKEEENALEIFNELIVIENNIQDFDLYFFRGNHFLRKKEYNNAMNDYSKALKIKPDYAYKVYFKIGVIFEEMNEHKKAIIYYDKVIEINSKDAETWFRKASLHALLRNKEEMLKSLKRTIELETYQGLIMDDNFGDNIFKYYWDDPDFKKLVE